MSSIELKLYEILKVKLGEQEATMFFEFIEAKTEEKYEQKKDVLMTKEDKIDLISRIESTKSDLIKWFFAFFITLALMIVGLYIRK